MVTLQVEKKANLKAELSLTPHCSQALKGPLPLCRGPEGLEAQLLGAWEARTEVDGSFRLMPLFLQVALDVVEEICAEMGLTRPEAFNEYVIFVVTNRGE